MVRGRCVSTTGSANGSLRGGSCANPGADPGTRHDNYSLVIWARTRPPAVRQQPGPRQPCSQRTPASLDLGYSSAGRRTPNSGLQVQIFQLSIPFASINNRCLQIGRSVAQIQTWLCGDKDVDMNMDQTSWDSDVQPSTITMHKKKMF